MTNNLHSYKDGFREGVVFLFRNSQGQYALESRQGKSDEYDDTFFPNGSVEVKDHNSELDSDYKQATLLREVDEEFLGKVSLKEYAHLCDTKVEAIGLVFYVFIITDWEGEIPDWTYEDGEEFGKVTWCNYDEAVALSHYDSVAEILEKAERY